MDVLVVDDDLLSLQVLRKTLTEVGYNVFAARDGDDAWNILEHQDISLLITDWCMPEVNGLELIRRIRELRPDHYIYVILLTAKSGTRTISEAVDAGADDFLSKPLDLKEFLARVRAGKRIVDLERRLALRNAELFAMNSRMTADLALAADIQRKRLPLEPPTWDNVSFDWHYQPCTELAGDILNIAPLDERFIAFYLLDVSGHGVSAALLSVTLSHVISSMMSRPASAAGFVRRRPHLPQTVATQLNDQFQFGTALPQFFTMFYGVLDRRTQELTYCSAGHPPPVLLPRNGEPMLLEPTGPAIGIMDDGRFTQSSIQLHPGDRLFVYSDGLPERNNPVGELFGTQRMMDSLHADTRSSPQQALRSLLGAIRDWSGGRPATDDMSCIVLESMEAAPSLPALLAGHHLPDGAITAETSATAVAVQDGMPLKAPRPHAV